MARRRTSLPAGEIESVAVEDFDRAGVLLKGVFLGINHAFPLMKPRNGRHH
jgi:hypothetical protein